LLNIQVLSIGRDKANWIRTGCDHYCKLLSRYARVELKPLPSAKISASLSPAEVKRAEAELLRKQTMGYTVALHDKGEEFESSGFADFLERLQIRSGGKVTFVIGGAFGLDESLLASADQTVSLSRLTLPHELARLILLEQLYRGFSILANTDYHK
jgi:23S rRNA (pseudouridine1915-N3)-methyltransferase